jgi:O-antigen ligase
VKDRASGRRGTAAWAIAVAALLVVGGGSALFPTIRMQGQLIGVALLAVALWRGDAGGGGPRSAAPLWLLGALAVLFILNLIPLPPALWERLPGRDIVADGDRLLFGAAQWRPISIDPDATLQSALMLVPAIAFFVMGWRGSEPRLYAVVAGILAAAGISLLLALVQVALRGAPATYIYPTLHVGLPTGIFGNRNHQGAMFVMVAPFVAALASRRGRPDLRGMILTAAALALCVVGTLITGSRTAAALLPVGLAGAILILMPPVPPRRLAAIGAALVVLTLGAILLTVSLGGDALGALGNRAVPLDDARFRFWPAVVDAGRATLPLGTGIGTFRPAYDLFEPAYLVAPLYVAHAHNDYLEILLEAGIPGLLLVALFGGWAIMAGAAAWSSDGGNVNSLRPLGRAAAVAIVVVLLHSLADYPLRTTTLSAVFGFACAILARAAQRPATTSLSTPRATNRAPGGPVFTKASEQ